MSSADSLPCSAHCVSDVIAEVASMPDVLLRDATFADLTTLRVGGRPAAVLECGTVESLVSVVRGLDRDGVPLLVVGGGSNLVVGDDGKGVIDAVDAVDAVGAVGTVGAVGAVGTEESENADDAGDAGGSVAGTAPTVGELVVVRPVARSEPEIIGEVVVTGDRARDATGTVVVRAFAGIVWDDLVAWSVRQCGAGSTAPDGAPLGLGGLECLSGIPGTVGAAPVQNIGAYGAEVSASLHRVQLLDRSTGELAWVEPDSLDLAYRYSNLKFTARAVVAAVEFRLSADGLSVPLRFGELSRRLGVVAEESAPRRPVGAVRDAVLELRRGKGMVLDEADHDTWSAGSFFTNPVVVGEAARDAVIAKATVHCGARVAEAMPCYPVVSRDSSGAGQSGQKSGQTGEVRGAGQVSGIGRSGEGEERRTAAMAEETTTTTSYKFSAAWLIEHAGFPKGWKVGAAEGGTGRASLSTKHTLALTNRGEASTADIVALATAVRDGVRAVFGVTLVPEPVWVGVTLPE